MKDKLIEIGDLAREICGYQDEVPDIERKAECSKKIIALARDLLRENAENRKMPPKGNEVVKGDEKTEDVRKRILGLVALLADLKPCLHGTQLQDNIEALVNNLAARTGDELLADLETIAGEAKGIYDNYHIGMGNTSIKNGAARISRIVAKLTASLGAAEPLPGTIPSLSVYIDRLKAIVTEMKVNSVISAPTAAWLRYAIDRINPDYNEEWEKETISSLGAATSDKDVLGDGDAKAFCDKIGKTVVDDGDAQGEGEPEEPDRLEELLAERFHIHIRERHSDPGQGEC